VELVVHRLAPIQARFQEIHADPAYLDRVLDEGADKAKAVASQTLHRVMELVGLR